MEAYFMGQRNKMMQDNKNLFESKMSNYQAGSNGMVECSSAAYLESTAD
jgi:hypothetical protein